MRDSDGLTSTGEVTVIVQNLSDNNSVSGVVYFDKNGNGVRDAGERGMPGSLLTLTGDDNEGAAVTRTAISDDNGRVMVLICHNTDLGDGWEREGEDEWYFTEFSEKKSYPMGINIVVYAMTH